MSLFGEIYFFFLAALLLIPAVILGINERPLRYYGSVLTVVFVTLAVVSPYRQILYLAAYCLIQTVLVKSFMRIKDSQKDSSALFKLFVCLSVAPLVIFKIGGLMELSIFAFAGISYLTFKSVQMLIGIHDGLIKEVQTWDFLYFLLFYPSDSSGTIDRSRRFIQDMYHVPSRQEYLDLLTDTTEEDARQTYQDNIAIEAEYLLGYLETAYSSGGYYDDGLQASMDQIYADVVEKAQDLTAQIYSRAQYSVGQADKLDSGDFAVEVTVSPIEVVSLIPAEVYAEKWSSVQTARGITSDEQVEAMSDEDYMAMDAEYGMAMLDYLEELLPQLSYGEEQSIMVQLKQEEDGNYSPVSTGWQKIDEVMIDYAGAYLK